MVATRALDTNILPGVLGYTDYITPRPRDKAVTVVEGDTLDGHLKFLTIDGEKIQ